MLALTWLLCWSVTSVWLLARLNIMAPSFYSAPHFLFSGFLDSVCVYLGHWHCNLLWPKAWLSLGRYRWVPTWKLAAGYRGAVWSNAVFISQALGLPSRSLQDTGKLPGGCVTTQHWLIFRTHSINWWLQMVNYCAMFLMLICNLK